MKKKLVTLILVTISFSSMWAQEAMIGEIRLFAGNYAPQGWALCQGQLLNTQQYQALFAILGTTYGGDGITTFALPDLRERSPDFRRANNKSEASKHTNAPAKIVAMYKYCMCILIKEDK